MITRILSLLSHPGRMRAMIALHTLSGIAQGIALALLVPFLEAFLARHYTSPWLWWLAGAVGASMALGAAGSLSAFRIGAYDICGNLIRRVGARLQELPLGWFDATSSGRVTTATSTGVNTLSHLPSIVLPQLASMVGTVASVVVATLFFNWPMGVATCVAIPVSAWALRILRRAVVTEHHNEAEAMKHLSTKVLEFSRHQAVLRATDQCRDGWAPLEAALAEEHRTTDRSGLAKGPAGTLFHAGVQAALVLAIALGIQQLLAGTVSAPVFIALTLIAVRFAEPVGMLAFYVDPIHQSGVALDEITAVLDAPNLPSPAEGAEKTPGTPLDITFTGVDFAYTPQRPVLKGVDLKVQAGTVTALVGPSGSGKSTLLRLAARFWDVTSGQVALGGVDVRDMTSSELMSKMSMVFQDVYLFDTSIEENVRIGRPSATDEEVRLASFRAGLDEVVARLPQGWDTPVGEGGKALSGGERQRVALARAFLKDSPVLLLDEVTSALDGVNEASVSRSLEELSRGRTVLVIAHRLSTIKRADRIAVLSGGRIEAEGTHEELLARGGTYRQFWEDQVAVERWHL